MNVVKVDETKGIRLEFLKPGDYYAPEIVTPDEFKLRRVVTQTQPKPSRDEALRAIESSPLQFTRSWDVLKSETRA